MFTGRRVGVGCVPLKRVSDMVAGGIENYMLQKLNAYWYGTRKRRHMFSILAFWVGTATSVLFFGGFGGGSKVERGIWCDDAGCSTYHERFLKMSSFPSWRNVGNYLVFRINLKFIDIFWISLTKKIRMLFDFSSEWRL